MNPKKFPMNLFKNKKADSTPLLIIKKESNDTDIKEYKSIEDENYPDVPPDKIEQLRTSLKQLKNRTSIVIRNSEIIK